MDLVPDIELRYSKLRLSLTVPKAERGAASFDTVTTRILGIPSSILKRIRSFRGGSSSSETREVRLLDDVSGAIIPGRMTLVLGAPGWLGRLVISAACTIASLSPFAAPGSGKSSYLKALTGRLANPRQLRGTVRYSGLTRDEASKRCGRGRAQLQFAIVHLYMSISQRHRARPARAVRVAIGRALTVSNRARDSDVCGPQQVRRQCTPPLSNLKTIPCLLPS